MELAPGPVPAQLCCVMFEGRNLTPPPDKVATALQFYLQLSQIDQDIGNIPYAKRLVLLFEQNFSQPTNSGSLELADVTW